MIIHIVTVSTKYGDDVELYSHKPTKAELRKKELQIYGDFDLHPDHQVFVDYYGSVDSKVIGRILNEKENLNGRVWMLGLRWEIPFRRTTIRWSGNMWRM